MEAFNTYCNVLGWIVMCGCSACIIASAFGLFYLMFKKGNNILKRIDMTREENFLIEKPQPVYDEKGNVKYYRDDEYIYIRHNGELLDIN